MTALVLRLLPVLLGRFRDRLRLDSLPIHLIDPAADRIQRGNAALGQREDSPGRRPGQLRQLVDAPDELIPDLGQRQTFLRLAHQLLHSKRVYLLQLGQHFKALLLAL